MNRTVIASGLAVASLGVVLFGGSKAIATGRHTPEFFPVAVGAPSTQDLQVRDAIMRSGTSSGVVRASGGWNRCPNSFTCLFDRIGGEGDMAYFRRGSPNLAAQHFDKRASSMWIRTNNYWDFWDLPNYRHGTGSLQNFTNGGYNLNEYLYDNKMSSLRAHN